MLNPSSKLFHFQFYGAIITTANFGAFLFPVYCQEASVGVYKKDGPRSFVKFSLKH